MDVDIGYHRPLHAQQKADTTDTSSYRNLWMAAWHRCSNQNVKSLLLTGHYCGKFLGKHALIYELE